MSIQVYKAGDVNFFLGCLVLVIGNVGTPFFARGEYVTVEVSLSYY